jgi:hypothetical protein
MTYFFVGKHFCIPLSFLQVSFFSFPPFVLKQKVEPKVQGRHDRSAHAAWPSHNNQSLRVKGIHSVLGSSLSLFTSLPYLLAYHFFLMLIMHHTAGALFRLVLFTVK